MCREVRLMSPVRHAVCESNVTDFEEENKTITLTVPTQGSIPVISISNWIMFLHREVASGFNWGLNWNDYKNGFGSSNSEDFWLVLERSELGRRTSGWAWRDSIS